MPIGVRLVALLSIPLLAVLVLAGVGVASSMARSNEASTLRSDTDLALAAYGLVDALQAERGALVADGSSDERLRGEVAAASAAVRDAAESTNGELTERTDRVLARVDELGVLPARELAPALALKAYSASVRQLLDLASEAIDPEGTIDSGPSAAVDYLARAQAAASEEYDLATLVSGETVTAAEFERFMALGSEQQSYSDLAAASAAPELASEIRRVGFAMNAADEARRSLLGEGSTNAVESWRTNLADRSEQFSELRVTATQDAIAAVDKLAANARTLLIGAIAVAGLILLATLFLLRWARRSIARPLRDLADQAEDVARVRLPAAVAAQDVPGAAPPRLPALRGGGATEVDEVAVAFNEVQDTALRLAGEQTALRVNQAEALTNLARRNQTLLARQLDFISSLEQRETDPEFLDHLFRLDHLASRMRRNAESLLILAGSETRRRRHRPAEVAQIVRSAMSEVEDFERVRIGHLRDATIVGATVIDLVHLLSELIENALTFSPPDTTVEIDGRGMVQGGYQFAVVDHGVGMSDLELVAANHRLSGEDEINGMPTRFLGQYVVAKLAAKIGAMVRLQPTAGGSGITAVVLLPSAAVEGSPDRSAAASPLPGSVAARQQGPTPFAPGAAPEAGDEVDVDLVALAAASVDETDTTDETDTIDAADAVDAVDEPVEESIDADADSDSDIDAALAALVTPVEPVEPVEPVAGEIQMDTDDVLSPVVEGADAVHPLDAAAEEIFGLAETTESADLDDLTEDHDAIDTDALDVPAMRDWPAPTGPALDAPEVELPVTDVEPVIAESWDPIPAEDELPVADVEPVIAGSWDPIPAEGDEDDDDIEAPETPGAPTFDVWASFLADETPAPDPTPEPELDDVEELPAAFAPDGHEWSGSGDLGTDADPAVTQDEPAPAAEPWSAPVPATSGATEHGDGPGTSEAPTSSLEPTGPRTGGLTRRVPGRSLSDRSETFAAAVSPKADRSPDGVRSMLDSFQAGRLRGRAAPVSDDLSETDAGDSQHPVPTPPDPFAPHPLAQDGRSSQ